MTRKLLIALTAAVLLATVAGLQSSFATGEARTLLLTLADGRTLTVSVQAEAGTPADQIAVPDVGAQVISVQDVTPPPADTQLPPAPATTPATPTTPATTPEPQRSDSSLGDAEPEADTQREQGTTGSKKLQQADRAQGEREGSSDEDAERDPDAPDADPSADVSIAMPGPAPVGVPNFFIEKFRIPPFLLPIYQAAGIEYGIRWEILAAINEIETDYGRNLNVSSAGALGWMQFMPPTWKAYGVDANRDGKKDPYNPVDAIFAAARYLKAAGADEDLRKAIFAYNRADWYVEMVLMRAKIVAGMPSDLIGSLSGLTQGLFPVHAEAQYAGAVNPAKAAQKKKAGQNAAVPVDSDADRRQIRIYAESGAPVTAVQDGTITEIGKNDRLGRFVRLRDAYGNTYTYGHLKSVSTEIAVAKPSRTQSAAEIAKDLELPAADPKPTRAASTTAKKRTAATGSSSSASDAAPLTTPRPAQPVEPKERLFANPQRPAAYAAGGREQMLGDTSSLPQDITFRRYFTIDYGLKRDDVVLKQLEVGRRVIAGTILGRIGAPEGTPADSRNAQPHVLFEIRPAGRGAPRIDPKPILDGWKLLESTAIYRAKGQNPLLGENSKATIGQILLMDKQTLQRRVLANPRIKIYEGGRRDIRAGVIDRRVLASLEVLAANGLKPTVTSLRSGRGGLYTKSGNISHHITGSAVDIAAINDTPVLGNQGEGSITDTAVRQLLTLQGTMKPAQIITLMKYEGTDNTVAMSDHHDHIHIGWRPMYDPRSKTGRQLEALLKPGQWSKLIDRLNEIENPRISTEPSKYALTVTPPRDDASDATE
jgi:hypothetical protein